ncbi:transposase [Roseicyclus mahoneyensis]|uniref:Transposase n=1 Tax=Roseicyclus mahoneyensis TaxID=164332 RepID=A0A316GJ98_9RHOB|nr:transposase [Roseicyclus mahoneyensis]
MLDRTVTLPEDPEELRSFTARLLAEVKAQAVLIEKLRHQLAGHRAHRFGASSETAEQLQLALETSEIAAAAMTARMKLPDIEEKDKPKRRPIPDHIPRMEVELAPSADACADCGGRMRRIGEDVTEELEYVPGRFIVNRIVRPRFACACCERFIQAPLPSRPIERGRPGPGLLAHVLVSKYADHLPLYRQSQIFDREGLDLDRSTLADWVGKTTALLEPLADAIGRHVLSAEAIFADDTPVRMLAPGTGKTQTARLWTYARDERPWGGTAAPAAWFKFSGDRKGQHPKDHLARFRGWMHADGYAGFEDLYRTGAIREVACMAPSRDIAAQCPAGQCMSGASSSTFTGRRAPRSPKRPSAGSRNSTPSRRKPEGRHQISGSRFAEHMRPRSSTTWRSGWPCNSPRSRANPRSRPPSAMP